MPLKDRIDVVNKIKVWCGELPVESLYTVGIAGERFFRTLKDKGEIVGTRCDECGMVYVPGRIFCERCFNSLDKWVKVSSAGVLESWTMVYVDIHGKRLDQPILVGLIKLDGASTALLHRLDKVDPDELFIGMRVRAVIKPKSKREGAITDILYFQPE